MFSVTQFREVTASLFISHAVCGFKQPVLKQHHEAYLQNKTEVSRRLVFVLKVFAVVDVYIVKLEEAHKVTGRLEIK